MWGLPPPGAYEGRQVAIEIVRVARTKRPDRSALHFSQGQLSSG